MMRPAFAGARPLAGTMLIAAIVWLGTASSAAATEKEILGGHEGWLDRMGAGIRELGMGNTGTASEEAMPSAYWNPAILPFNRQTVAGVGADMRSLSRNGGYAGIQGRLAANLGVGLALLNRGDLHVQAYDQDENDIGIAKPQFLGSYLGMGLRTSRNNSFGTAVQWYSSNLDVGGSIGNVNVIGIFNLGWYRRWTPDLKSAVVARNLGLNGRLSADFEQTTLTGEDALGFERTAGDFMPKTLVAAVFYTARLRGKPIDLALEVMDYQLKDDLYALDANFHAQGLRLGADYRPLENVAVRAGFDQGNYSAGFGYTLPWGKRKLIFDYALLAEGNLLTFNFMAVGLRFTL